MARAFPRAPFTSEVTYFEWGHPREARAAEIGGNGMFLRTRDLLPVGSFVTVRLALPGLGRGFTVLSKVVRVVRGGRAGLSPSGMGLEFVDIGASNRGRVLAYIARFGPLAA